MIDLRQILENVKYALPTDHNYLDPEGFISPFVSKNIGIIEPGVKSDDLYRFHELFPKLYSEETSFMGGSKYRNSDKYPVITGKPELLYAETGKYISEKEFVAPIAVYVLKELESYILFQKGNYQIIEGDQEKHIKNKEIKIYRGLKNNTQYRHVTLKEDLVKEYIKYVAMSFLNQDLIIDFNAKAGNSKVSHMKYISPKTFTKICHKGYMTSLIDQSFSTNRIVSSSKFGPNYVSMITPINNIKILSQYSDELEVNLIDKNKVKNIEFHNNYLDSKIMKLEQEMKELKKSLNLI